MKKIMLAAVAASFMSTGAHAVQLPAEGQVCSDIHSNITSGINVVELSDYRKCVMIQHDIDTAFTYKTFHVRTGTEFTSFPVADLAKMNRSERVEFIKSGVHKAILESALTKQAEAYDELILKIQTKFSKENADLAAIAEELRTTIKMRDKTITDLNLIIDADKLEIKHITKLKKENEDEVKRLTKALTAEEQKVIAQATTISQRNQALLDARKSRQSVISRLQTALGVDATVGSFSSTEDTLIALVAGLEEVTRRDELAKLSAIAGISFSTLDTTEQRRAILAGYITSAVEVLGMYGSLEAAFIDARARALDSFDENTRVSIEDGGSYIANDWHVAKGNKVARQNITTTTYEDDSRWGTITKIDFLVNGSKPVGGQVSFFGDLDDNAMIAIDRVVGNLEKAFEAGYDYGYDKGYDAGYKDGYRDGFNDGVNSVTK